MFSLHELTGTKAVTLASGASWKRLPVRSFGNHQPRGGNNLLARLKARVKQNIALVIAKKEVGNDEIPPSLVKDRNVRIWQEELVNATSNTSLFIYRELSLSLSLSA